MTCASCGRTNRDDSRFCVGCGSALAMRCPACGREAESDARFCGACGSPLTAAAPAATAARAAQPTVAAVARKIVTIVFADLAGSTALHERLDAESARALMDRYYRTLHTVVDAHGGTVVKLLGDGVMVAFGVPRVAEDDAIRAVRAAVGMQQAFRTLAEEQAAALGAMGLRVAVNTGEVVVSGAHDDVVGDPVNVAARLQQEAQDGDVLIGEATRRLVSDLVTLELVGTLTLKGRAESVAAYRVVSLERPAGAPALAFVGRDDELRRLMAVYDAAVAGSAARLAVILGSPGLGKSRLVGELVRRLGESATVMSAHCDATGGATFAPLADGLRALLRLDDGTAGDTIRTAIEDRMGADAPDRARIATGVAALLAGTPAAPEETFFVVRRFLAALAAAQPVVLVIDDLQWAEPLLLDLVEHLVQWSTDAPLLVLVAARPELRETRSSLVVPGSLVAEVVTLAGLDAGAATRLAANAIGGDELPAAVAGRVLAISEGNPLFVGELVRMLVQDGALKREGDRWTTAVELSTLAMPPTIHALLAARIERLRPEERMVLERAAVVGRQFSRTAIARLLPREVTDLDARLEALRRSELIEPATGWFLGEPALTFHHGLIRDAAYRRILKGTRAELHERFADWLESRVGESIEHDETMGWHLEQAHQHLRELGPIDAHGRAIGERAARHLAAAGRRALERDDLPLAGSLLGRAVDRLDAGDPTRADLALDWCEALLTAGDVGPAAAAVAELARFTDSSERLRAWHTCFAGQLAALTDPATLRNTADAVAGAATVLASLDDAAGEAKAHAVHATALARLGEIGACEAALDRALAAARRAGDRRRANAVLAGAPVAALWGPSPVTRASGRCLDVVRVLRITQGAPAVEAVALRCQAVLEALRGRAEAARRMIAASRQLVEELGITQRLLEAEVSTGLIELLEGDAVAAERALHPAYDGLRRHGLGIDAAQAAALLGRALLAQDRAAEAEALSHESELLAGDDLKAAIAWRGVRAEALARRGEHAEAITFARAAVAIAAATDALLDHADARLALAAALRAAGKNADADAEETRAVALWEAKGATLLAERARHDGARPDPAARAPEDRVEPASPVRRRVRANAATANTARYGAALNARNVADCIALTADDYVGVHHATGLTYDRAAALARLHAVFKSQDLVIAQEPLATLGDTLALFRQSTSSSGASGRTFDVGPYDLENICLVEFDDTEGRRRRFEQFADDRLGDAVARLYERYAEILPEGPVRARAAATARSVAVQIAPFDLERWATIFARDIEVVDHRTVGFGTLHGAETLMRAIRALLDLVDRIDGRVDDVLGLDAAALLVRQTSFGTERVGGGAFERVLCELWVFGANGLLTRWERFDVEHTEAALARFDALTGGTSMGFTLRPGVRSNTATAAVARADAALAARDLAALAALISDACVEVHHPTGTTYGRDDQLDSFARFLRSREPRTRREELATLGDSFCLYRFWMGASGTGAGRFDVGDYETEHLGVVEVDEHGRLLRSENFATDRLGDAITNLYARYAERLLDSPAAIRAAATARAVAAMVAPPDLDRYASALAPDVAFVDHRTVGFASGRGADSLLRGFRSLLDLADDVTTRVDEVLRLEADALLLRWTITGIDRASGGPFESEFLLLWLFGPDGRVVHDETFDANRAAEAVARFDSLVGSAGTESTPEAIWATTPFENAAAQSTRRLSVLWRARDWPGMLETLPMEFRYVDRRPMAQLELDRGGYVEFIRQLGDMGTVRIDWEVLATRGDHLALDWVRVEVAGGDVRPSVVEFLDVVETDDRGDPVARIRFDPDDHDAAYAELDARFAAREAEAHPLAAAWAWAFRCLAAARDWDGLVARCAPTFVAYDHRLVSWGTLDDGAAWVRTLRALVELAPDARYCANHLRISDRGWLVEGGWVGTREGGPFEIATISVSEVDELGRNVRNDVYELTQRDEALARFAAIGREAAAATPPPRFANAATHWMYRFTASYRARDWQRVAQLLAVGFRFVDRRRMAQLELDRDRYVAFTRQLGDMHSVRVGIEVLATRGDRLELHRLRMEVADDAIGPSELEHLNVIETDEGGDAVAWSRFDPANFDAAYAELDARFEAGEGARYDAALTANRAIRDTGTQHDWEALTAALAPTFSADDHRLLGWGTTLADRATFVRSQQALAELAPDFRLRAEHLRISDRGFFVQGAQYGTREGGAFESPLLAVAEVDAAGLVLHYDLYDLDDYERARARFDALRPDPLRIPPNAATRANDRICECGETENWDALRTLLTPVVFEDRRRLIRTTGDCEMVVRNIQVVWQFGARPGRTLLATAGDRLALQRTLWTAPGDEQAFEIENLDIIEVDTQGRVVASIIFDPDDRAAASAELAERYARSTVPPAGADRVVEMIRARRDRDLARIRTSLPDDFYFDDHRRTGLGRVEGTGAYVASLAALFEQSPDIIIGESLYHVAEASYGALYVGRTFGTLNDGGEFESVFLAIILFGNDGPLGGELFELEDLDRARARFEELRPDPLRMRPNAATRALARAADAFAARDWTAVRALTADGFVYEDRSNRASVHGDVETWIGAQQFWAEVPGFTATIELIGTVGDRIAIEHIVGKGGPGGDDFELEGIRVLEVDDAGRFRASVKFDPEDRPAAAVEAMRRFVAGEAGAAEGLETCLAVGRAFSLHRWDEIRAALTSDFVFVDHRTLGLGTLDGDQWITAMRALAELAPDFAAETRQVLAWNRHGFVAAARNFGTVPGGGPFENLYIAFALTAGGRVQRYEAFDPTDTDGALARFAELSRENGETK